MCRVYVTVMISVLVAGWSAQGADVDLDGVDDASDVCCNTPPGTAVDAEGRPIGDLDGDCDNDLADFQIFLSGHTGFMTPPVHPHGEACDDGDPCTTDDRYACGLCAGTPYTCDDSIPCTIDECLGDGSCRFDVAEGECLIDGTCYLEGDGAPGWLCMACQPSFSQTNWAPRPSGTPCDDGLVCTSNDACNGAGVCVGDLSGCPSLECEEPVCNATGGCDVVLKPGWCRIAGTCFLDGTSHPANECQYCDAVAPERWSNATGSCDDGDNCTHTDTCVDSICVGVPYSCDDGISCTKDLCDGTGACENPIYADACLIEGTCYDDGESIPTEPCLICAPDVSQTSWDQLPNGMTCDDGESCTHTDECVNGICVGVPYSCDDGKPCTQDICDGTGLCENSVYANACLIEGFCYIVGDTNRDNECLSCLAGSPTSWAPTPEGTECDDGNIWTFFDECDGHGHCVGR